MLIISVSLLCCSIILWPLPAARQRLRSIVPSLIGEQERRYLPLPVNAFLALCGGVIGWFVLGPGGAVANAVLCLTWRKRWKARSERRNKTKAATELVESLGTFVAELRVGAHPAVAAESTAKAAESLSAKTMMIIANTAQLGGNVRHALIRFAKEQPAVAGVLKQVARAWALSDRHGIPLADVLDTVRKNLEQHLRFAKQVRARMAGPRMSATVLAILPELGVLLGEAIDARPLHVLATTYVGQGLLIAGATLICVGVFWSAKLTEHVVTL